MNHKLLLVLSLYCLVSCATVPAPSHPKFTFPKEAFVGDVKRPYKVLGQVRSKVNFATLDFDHEEDALCANFYNKAVRDLVRRSKEQGGDAVIDVKSVVFLEDGRREVYVTPECADEGAEGQILVQGIAVRWQEQIIPPRTE